MLGVASALFSIYLVNTDGNRTGLIHLRVAVRLRRKSINWMSGAQISLRQRFRLRPSTRLRFTTC